MNNYGVWTDEWKALGLESTLERSWDDAVCWFGESKRTKLGRGYGRVSRRKLREHLLRVCAASGVSFLPGEVTALEVPESGNSTLTTAEGVRLRARQVHVARPKVGLVVIRRFSNLGGSRVI